MVRSENYCQMPPSACTFNMEQCGAVPNIVDTIQISMVRAYEARPGGYRISQFPNKKIFYDWVKSVLQLRLLDVYFYLLCFSDCGAMFRDEMCKVRSLNTYIATFTRDLF
ncbi:unnamed protein product [Dibothriocephalus latus]|uniref:Uncharacterized protein n=1 Tax=Dibothriocephalus latus TaxID=60516 RepID=A0A3P7LU35_DIBLA|nr:unnamed protein product [Dibothriocephalus latus]